MPRNLLPYIAHHHIAVRKAGAAVDCYQRQRVTPDAVRLVANIDIRCMNDSNVVRKNLPNQDQGDKKPGNAGNRFSHAGEHQKREDVTEQ